jgi:hypothetical protein
VWFAKAKGIREQIDEAGRLYERLLLIVSWHNMKSHISYLPYGTVISTAGYFFKSVASTV